MIIDINKKANYYTLPKYGFAGGKNWIQKFPFVALANRSDKPGPLQNTIEIDTTQRL